MENKQEKCPAELADSELEEVTGGLKVAILGQKRVTTCDNFACVWCGRKKASPAEADHICHPQGDAVFANVCNECVHLGSCSKAYSFQNFSFPGANSRL